MDERQLTELFTDVAADVEHNAPPATFDHAQVLAGSRKAADRARRWQTSAAAVAVLTVVGAGLTSIQFLGTSARPPSHALAEPASGTPEPTRPSPHIFAQRALPPGAEPAVPPPAEMAPSAPPTDGAPATPPNTTSSAPLDAGRATPPNADRPGLPNDNRPAPPDAEAHRGPDHRSADGNIPPIPFEAAPPPVGAPAAPRTPLTPFGLSRDESPAERPLPDSPAGPPAGPAPGAPAEPHAGAPAGPLPGAAGPAPGPPAGPPAPFGDQKRLATSSCAQPDQALFSQLSAALPAARGAVPRPLGDSTPCPPGGRGVEVDVNELGGRGTLRVLLSPPGASGMSVPGGDVAMYRTSARTSSGGRLTVVLIPADPNRLPFANQLNRLAHTLARRN